MSYIDLINRFWCMDEICEFSPIETRLYFYLLNAANRTGWRSMLSRKDDRIALEVGVSVNTIKKARKRLEEVNLISVIPGGKGKGDKTLYVLHIGFECNSCVEQPSSNPICPIKDRIGINSRTAVGVKSDALGVKPNGLGIKSDTLGVKSDTLGVKSDTLGVKSDAGENGLGTSLGVSLGVKNCDQYNRYNKTKTKNNINSPSLSVSPSGEDAPTSVQEKKADGKELACSAIDRMEQVADRIGTACHQTVDPKQNDETPATEPAAQVHIEAKPVDAKAASVKTTANKRTEAEEINFEKLVDLFNSRFSGKLPKVIKITDDRKRAVRRRVSQYGKDAVLQVFDAVERSSFLMGEGARSWRCDFDWIFKPSNFVKILEGVYENHANNGQTGTYETAVADRQAKRNASSRSDAEDKRREREALGMLADAILQQSASEIVG